MLQKVLSGQPANHLPGPTSGPGFFSWLSLLDSARGREHLIGSRSHADIFGEILPAHNARAIHQKLRRPGDVMPIGTTARVQQIIAADDIHLWIGEQRKCEPGLMPQILRHTRWVHTDRHRHDTLRLKFREPFLDASQLEDAERSPVSAIKDQQHGLRRGTRV